MMLSTSPNLLRPVRSIAGVAEAGHDECALVEGFVDCSRPDRYVGMGSTHPLDALKSADQANKPYLLSPSFFQPVHSRDRSIRSSKDRNDHNYEPLAEIGWRLEEILDRNESLRLAIKADMRHSRSWNEIEHSFRKRHASTKDRGKYKLLAGDAWSDHTCERRLDLDIGQRQIARYLVAQQHPYLFEELSKGLG